VANPTCGTTPTGATATTYDSLGERKTFGSTSYGYDQAGRLATFTGATTATYGYNGDGQRMAKTVGVATTTYVWGGGKTPNVLSDGVNSYLYGPDGLPIEQVGSATYWFVHDQIGSTIGLLDGSGAVAGRSTYTPYGAVSSTGAAHTPLMYTGQYTDAESGLVYLRARYYDPGTALFLTVDPSVAKTKAAYTYAGGDPLANRDLSGQDFWGDLGIGLGIAGAVIGGVACFIAEPCGIGAVAIAGGGSMLVVSGSGAAAIGGGAVAGGLLAGGMHAASNSRGGGGSSSDPAPANSGRAARPTSQIPNSSGCEETAVDIQKTIGGDRYRITDQYNAPSLGKYRGQDTYWDHHDVVVLDGRVYDDWTGPEGQPMDEYRNEFQYGDDLNFTKIG